MTSAKYIKGTYDINWPEFGAAMMLMFWCNIIFFETIHSNIGNILISISFLLSSIILVLKIKEISIYSIVLIFITSLICLISYLLPPGNTYLGEYLFRFLVVGSMSVLMISIIKNPRYIIICWLIYSLPIALLSIKYFLTRNDWIYMSISYNILPLYLWVLIFTVKKSKWYYYIILISLLILILLLGTRGTIITALISILIAILLLKKKTYKYKYYKSLFLLAIVYFTFHLLFIKDGNNLLKIIVETIGVKSRIITLITQNSLVNSEARNSIYIQLYNAIINNFPYGLGLCGDSYILKNNYAHNFLLELFIDFGLLALIMIILFVKLVKNSLFITTNIEWKIVGLLFLFNGLLPKIFSFNLLHPLTLPMIAVLLQIQKMENIKYKVVKIISAKMQKLNINTN